ncbi:MAG TPA: FliH/SctL family protein [Polyangiaceae bacterium]
MPSFDRKSERPPAARFLDVTEGKLRAPAWIASQKAGFKRRSSDSNFRAPRLPSEFRTLDVTALATGEHRASVAPSGAEPTMSRLRVPGARPTEPPPPPGGGDLEPALDAIRHRPSVVPLRVEPDPVLIQAFLDAIDGLAQARQMVLEDSAHEIAELATTIARRVIARELSIDPAIVQGLVQEGLSVLGRDDRITVRLGARFARAASAIEQRLTVGDQRVEIVLDPTLEPHGCIVETDLGRVDESIESRLSALITALESDSRPPGN